MHSPQCLPQRSAHNASMGYDDVAARWQGQKRGRGAGVQRAKTFPIWRGERGQICLRQWAKVGKVGVRHPFPIAKILLAQAGVLARRYIIPKDGGGLQAAQRRAGVQRITSTHFYPRAQGIKGRDVAAICRNIAPPCHGPAIHAGRVADQPDISNGNLGGHMGGFALALTPPI